VETEEDEEAKGAVAEGDGFCRLTSMLWFLSIHLSNHPREKPFRSFVALEKPGRLLEGSHEGHGG
jgi:hypothetical protein